MKNFTTPSTDGPLTKITTDDDALQINVEVMNILNNVFHYTSLGIAGFFCAEVRMIWKLKDMLRKNNIYLLQFSCSLFNEYMLEKKLRKTNEKRKSSSLSSSAAVRAVLKVVVVIVVETHI